MLMKFTGITVFNPIGKWSNAGMLNKGQAKGLPFVLEMDAPSGQKRDWVS
jgi:hypothetical protein